MILVPNISGSALRVKIENTMGEVPVIFSGAFIGVAGDGAAVQEGSITRLTFAGEPGLSLAAGQGAYSDPARRLNAVSSKMITRRTHGPYLS